MRLCGPRTILYRPIKIINMLRIAQGRAIAQAVGRRYPTSAVRVRAQVRLCGICGGLNGTGAGVFLSTSVSLANHFADCSTFVIIYHPGLVQQVRYWPTYQADLGLTSS
jgi:hypothetical protein